MLSAKAGIVLIWSFNFEKNQYRTVHTCAYIKFFLKKYSSGLVEGVGYIFRIVCQISGQDNTSYKSENHIDKRLL